MDDNNTSSETNDSRNKTVVPTNIDNVNNKVNNNNSEECNTVVNNRSLAPNEEELDLEQVQSKVKLTRTNEVFFSNIHSKNKSMYSSLPIDTGVKPQKKKLV